MTITSLAITTICIIGLAMGAPLAADDPRSADRIVKLPRAPDILFDQFSGHVVVNEILGKKLFYWLIKAVDYPDDKPLVLWLSGGPGCSSVGYGEASEIGPFLVDDGGQSLNFNEFSWNRAANLLFLETPAGVGFSRSNSTSKSNYNDRVTAGDNIIFLIKWLERFPEYRDRDTFITGSSYSGHYVPQLTQKIMEYNKVHSDQPIKIRGIMVGNPELNTLHDQLGRTEFFYDHGMISNETYNGILESCMSSFETGDFTDRCIAFYDVKTAEEIGRVDKYSIFTDYCSSPTVGLVPSYYGGSRVKYNPCYEDLLNIYFNLPDVQLAMHAISSNETPISWSACNELIFSQWSFDVLSVLPILQDIINAGIRLYFYSGDTDSMFPFTGTRRALASLNLPITKNWYPWYYDKKHRGWAIKYKGITFATLRGANHQAPQLAPEAALVLFTLFLNGADPSDNP